MTGGETRAAVEGNSEQEVQSRLASVQVGVWLTVIVSVGCALYALETWDHPNRALILDHNRARADQRPADQGHAPRADRQRPVPRPLLRRLVDRGPGADRDPRRAGWWLEQRLHDAAGAAVPVRLPLLSDPLDRARRRECRRCSSHPLPGRRRRLPLLGVRSLRRHLHRAARRLGGPQSASADGARSPRRRAPSRAARSRAGFRPISRARSRGSVSTRWRARTSRSSPARPAGS